MCFGHRMIRCDCGGYVPFGISRCPHCEAFRLRPPEAWMMAALAAAQALTACACYGGPCTTMSRGALVSCAAVDCSTPLADGGSPTTDPAESFCFVGPVTTDGGTDGGSDGGP